MILPTCIQFIRTDSGASRLRYIFASLQERDCWLQEKRNNGFVDLQANGVMGPVPSHQLYVDLWLDKLILGPTLIWP